MRWEDFRRSENVEERSGTSGGGFPLGGGMRLGIGGIVIAVIVGMLFGINPLQMLGMLMGGGGPAIEAPAPSGPQSEPRRTDPQRPFVEKVVGDTEDVWGRVFQSGGARYDAPKVTIFHGGVQTDCGTATRAVGPFYCPNDRHVYLDTSFFDDLARRFGAPGEAARAYVIAHEIGHHVQNLSGIMDRFDQQAQRSDSRSRNALSVRLELQADCYAGIWANSAGKRNVWEPGDVEAMMRAASAVGDDRLQRQAQGYVAPDSFTHGSSAQRTRWFRVGLETGDMRRCNTFAASEL